MTVTVTNIDQGPFTATGLAQTVSYTFMTLTDEEISVFYDAGAGRVLIDPAAHTVTRNKNIDGSAKEGGSVELAVAAAPAGSSIYLRANPRVDRDLVWSDTGSRLKNLNEENDRSVLRILVLADVLAKNIDGMSAAGADAGASAGAAAALLVLASKADSNLLNANLPSGSWLKAGGLNLLRRQANGFLEPALSIHRDTSGQFIDRLAFLLTGLRYVVSPGAVVPQIHIINDVLGDNATFQGATGAFVKSQSNAAETNATKGVLYCFTGSVAPKNARNNFPFDDATPFVASNDGQAIATEAYYVGRNAAIPQDFASSFGSDASGNNWGYGTGTYDYGLDFCWGAGNASIANGALHVGNNIKSVVSRDAADATDLVDLRRNPSNILELDGKAVRPWGTWSPVPTATSGAFTYDGLTARWSEVNKTVTATFAMHVILKNTAAGGLVVPLPVTAAASGRWMVVGRGTASTLFLAGVIQPGATSVTLTRDGGLDPFFNDDFITVQLIYERA